jgi:hypothetical protein
MGIPFKATAGLHHPVRRDDEHGFLNLLSAAVFGDEEAALAETEPAAEELAGVRQRLFVSIGSCSFREPIDDLTALGVFPL